MNPPSRTRASAFSTLSALLAAAAITFTLAPGAAIAQEQIARLVRDSNRDLSSNNTQIGWVAPLANRVVFLHANRQAPLELWSSNGDAKTTLSLETSKDWTDATPFPFGTGAGAKVAINRAGADGTIGLDVWVTDGTPSGTLAVFQPAANWQSEVLAGTTNGFFFDHRLWSESEGEELYFSDGTVAGTRLLNPIVGENPRQFTGAEPAFTDGSWFYFTANGDEIWRSDGTDAGTTKVATVPIAETALLSSQKVGPQIFSIESTPLTGEADLWATPIAGGDSTHLFPPAGPLKYVEETTALGNELVFIARDVNFNFELWRSDGTVAGTRELVIPGESGWGPRAGEFTRWHGSLYFLCEFSNDLGTAQKEILYRIDAGSDTLTPVGTFAIGSSLIAESPVREKEPFLYFFSAKPDQAPELWQTNGTAAGTKLAKIPANHYLRTTDPSEITETGLGIFFAGTGLPKNQTEALYRAKGKKASTLLTPVPKWTADGIVDFDHPGDLPPHAPLYQQLGASTLAFINVGDGAYELWTMTPDGSKAKSIWKPTKPLQTPGSLTFRGNTTDGTRAIFTVINGTELIEYWVTDGTKKGTVLLTSSNVAPHDFVNFNGATYYSQLYTGLFKTDGTPEGTSLVKLISMQGSNMVVFQGSLYFIAAGPNNKNGLWRSDGTDAGTTLVKDGFHGISDELPTGLSVVGDKLVFWVRYSGARELWQSDGTTIGTVPITTPNFFKDGETDPVGSVNGMAIFPARKFADAYDQLFVWDTTNGLRPLQANPSTHGATFLYPWAEKHVTAGNRLFYVNYSDTSTSLWVTDGTDSGTQELLKPGTTNAPFNPSELLAVGDQVYFSGRNSTYGYELWRSDGTDAGTVLVADVEPARADSKPQGLKVMHDKLYFNADRRTVGRELFVIDLPTE